LIALSRRAEREVAALRRHFEKRGRPEAVVTPIAALRAVSSDIENQTALRLAAPRPYPELARPGRAWTTSGRYWVAYRTGPHPLIVAVFYDSADIPSRL
jgi:plasmid stabilization system protein ParE